MKKNYLEKVKIFTKCILLDGNGKFLALRRGMSDRRRPGGWDFPGGNFEKGEHILDSAKREVLEESGLQVRDLQPVYVDSGAGIYEKDLDVVAVCFSTENWSGEVVLSDEHDEFVWTKPQEFLELPTGNDGGFLHSAVRAYLKLV